MLTRSDSPPDAPSQLVPYVRALLQLHRGAGEPVSREAIEAVFARRQDALLQLALPGGDVGHVALQGGRPVYASYGSAAPEAALTALLTLAPQSTGSLLVLSPHEGELLFAALGGEVRRFALPIQSPFDLPALARALATGRFGGVVLIEDSPRIDIHLVRGGQLDRPLGSVGRLTILEWSPRALPPLAGVEAGALERALSRLRGVGAGKPAQGEVWNAFEREVTAELGPRAERFLLRMREAHAFEHDPDQLRRRLTTELRRLRGSGRL